VTKAIALKDITIHPVVEQQAPFFDVFEFFPTLTKELLEENRSWLQPTFIDPASGKLVLCVQSFVIKSAHHNILIDSCVGNDKPRPARPLWNMMKSDRFEQGLAAAGLTVNDIDYVMCTHLHVDHVGWNTRLENGRWVPTFPKAKYIMADRELAYWTPAPGSAGRDGVPATSYPARAEHTEPFFPGRDFSRGHGWGVPPLSAATSHRAAGVAGLLTTTADRPVDWVHAGQALQRILLTASICGAAVALHSQPLELPWLREVLRTQLSDAACPHLVLRIGLVTQVALSVRRDPGDVLFPAGDDRADPAPG